MGKPSWIALAAISLAFAPAAVAQSTGTQTSSAAQAEQSSANQKNSQKPAEAGKTPEQGQAATATKPKAPFVYTNNNLPAAPGSVSVMGTMNAEPVQETGKKKKNNDAESGDEAMWKSKFAAAREKLKQDQATLRLMRNNLQTDQQVFRADPNQAAANSVNLNDVAKKQQDILGQEKLILVDEQAISDLQDALRRAGGDPAWGK